jgi:hypothetical protein
VNWSESLREEECCSLLASFMETLERKAFRGWETRESVMEATEPFWRQTVQTSYGDSTISKGFFNVATNCMSVGLGMYVNRTLNTGRSKAEGVTDLVDAALVHSRAIRRIPDPVWF